jgi:AraC-like DNA-binding protein
MTEPSTCVRVLPAEAPFVQVRNWEHHGPRRRYPETAHDTLEVACVERGHVRYGVGSRTLDLGPGSVVVVPADVGHATSFESDVQAHALQFCASRVASVADAIGVEVLRDPLFVEDGARLGALTRLVREEASSEHVGRALAIESLCEALTVEVLRHNGSDARPQNDPRIRRAVDYVHSCFASALTVDDLARAAAMSRFHFSRCFREEVGMSPYRYVQHVRVQRAAPLLSARRPVAEVAHAVGFTDLSRFARAFRREMGCSPNAWARLRESRAQCA